MIQEYKDLQFNPKADTAEVDQFGFVDLCDAYVKHMIPAEAGEGNDNYDDVDEPDSIGRKPSDIFESYRMRDEVVARDRAKQSNEKNEPAGK